MKAFTRPLVVLLALALPVAAAAQSEPAAGTPKPAALAAAPEPAAEPAPAPAAPSQVIVLTGTVLTEAGAPLAGATVTLTADKSQTSITNANGMYELRATQPVAELHVSYAGYQDAVFTADAARPVTFQLEPVADYNRQLKKQTKAAEKAFRKP